VVRAREGFCHRGGQEQRGSGEDCKAFDFHGFSLVEEIWVIAVGV
jgi:hypothetical protein